MVNKKEYQNNMARVALLSILVLWTIFIAVLLRVNLLNVEKSTLQLAAKEARSSFKKDIIYRAWNASHGGVYVPISVSTVPNRYLLNIPERDITTPSGVKLTLINPSYMVRQVHELGEKEHGTKSNITSLKPIRSDNMPDDWEKKALIAFEAGKTEVISDQIMNGERYLRFMSPLIIKEGCLRCHTSQGYKIGDISGGISVSIPYSSYEKNSGLTKSSLIYGHLLVWFLGVFGIISTKLLINKRNLKRHADFESIVSKVSSNFVRLGPGNADDCINNALLSICEFTGADRGFVYQIIDEENIMKLTHKCFYNKEESIYFKKIKLLDIPLSVKKLQKFEMIHFSSINKLPKEAEFEKELLETSGIKSLIGVPLVLDEKLKGILYIDKLEQRQTWAKEDIILMQAVGETIIYAIDRERSEKILAGQTERLNNIIKGTNVGTWEWNIDTGDVIINERFAEILGYTKKEISPVTINRWIELCHPKDLEKAREIIKDCFNKKSEYFNYEARLLSKNNKWIWIRCSGKIITWSKDGKPKWMYGTHTDINREKQQEVERLKMQEKLQYTQRLDSLGVMAGGIAHDFNNILMSIMGNAELGIFMADKTERVKESFSEILSSSSRAADLCSQMLAFTGKGHMTKENISLKRLIYEMSDILKTSVTKKNSLSFDLETGLPDIFVDPLQIRQVLINLIVNASEAMDDKGGSIKISTGCIDLPNDEINNNFIIEPSFQGKHVYLEISDCGHGIDKDIIPRIFEPFYTTKFTGRGLGLSAVVGIVFGHNGALLVNSNGGKGTSFRVFFPAKNAFSTEVGVESRIDDWVGSGTVLLVDDEEKVRKVSIQMLEKLGLNVLTATDGYEAVEVYEKKKSEIDVVIMDYAMPNKSGYDAFAQLLKINPEIKVILATGYSGKDISSKFKGKGLIGCLEKPYSLSNLISVLSGLIPKANF